MPIVWIPIWRNEEQILVSVMITKYYKGTNDFDDPTEVETSDIGYDEKNCPYVLTLDEQSDAAAEFLSL